MLLKSRFVNMTFYKNSLAGGKAVLLGQPAVRPLTKTEPLPWAPHSSLPAWKRGKETPDRQNILLWWGISARTPGISGRCRSSPPGLRARWSPSGKFLRRGRNAYTCPSPFWGWPSKSAPAARPCQAVCNKSLLRNRKRREIRAFSGISWYN